jgi:hypothetical protein
LLLCCLMFLGSSGCASQRRGWTLRPAKQSMGTSEQGWWSAQFRIQWPENTEPSWHVGVCIAHRVILPILIEQGDNLALWRFHRRAARDQSGHRFSFIFYAPPETAEQIFTTLRTDTFLALMRDSGVVTDMGFDDTTTITRPDIEDTSDPNWSPQIQKSWPYFIMGVSQMWLSSIMEIVESTSHEYDPSSAQGMLGFYRDVDMRVKTLWQEEGRHSLLHHLSAIFGYVPIKLNRGDILFKF